MNWKISKLNVPLNSHREQLSCTTNLCCIKTGPLEDLQVTYTYEEFINRVKEVCIYTNFK